MSAYYTKLYAPTKEEAERKAKTEMENLGFMRQPALQSVSWTEGTDESPGQWVAVIKYWGLD